MKRTLFLIVVLLVCKAEAQSSVLSVADNLYNSGNYTAAINQYSKLGTEHASFQIAKAYNAIGNYDKSIAQYENVLEKNSNFNLARFNLGKLYLKIKKPEKAMLNFLKLTTSDKKNPEYFYYLGRSFEAIKKNKQSISWYKNAVQLDSTHLRSIFRIGKYYVAKKEKDSVLKYVDKGLSFYENDVALISLKAQAFFNYKNFEESIPLFEKLLELGEIKAFVYNKLAYAYFRAFEYDKAIETYKQLIVLQGMLAPDPKTFNDLANVYLKDRQLDSAKVYVKKAIDEKVFILDREYATLGRIASQKNDLKTAIKYYKMAHKEDSANPIYLYQVCILSDKYYKDPKLKLKQYEAFKEKYKNRKTNYFSAFTDRRISELKSEIFAKGN